MVRFYIMSTNFISSFISPSRSNANRSPNKQPKAMPRNGKFPGDYGEKSSRFGTQARYWNQLMANK
jgi:hypothetical protein